MNIISNNQSSLEKFFKSRNMIISVLVATSLLQAVHTAKVIVELSFIGTGLWSWVHSILLSICIELYIVVFSIRNQKSLAVMYLIFGIMINIGMAYIAHDFSFKFFFYALITTVFPLSVYYTADELSKKMHASAQPAIASSPDRPKRTYKKRRKSKLLD